MSDMVDRKLLEEMRKSLQSLEVQHKALVKSKAEMVRRHADLEHVHGELKQENARLKTLSMGLMLALDQFREESKRLFALGSLEETPEAVWIPQAMQFFEETAALFTGLSAALEPPTRAVKEAAFFKVRKRVEDGEDGYCEEIMSAAELEALLEQKPACVMEVLSAKG